MGNDLAGGKVLVTPEVLPVPVRQSADELAQKFPKVFAACAVTQAMSKKREEEVDLCDSFLCDPGDGGSSSPDAGGSGDVGKVTFPSAEHLSMSREQLMAEQRDVALLSPLFEAAVAGDKI